jgi:hypothetical protein
MTMPTPFATEATQQATTGHPFAAANAAPEATTPGTKAPRKKGRRLTMDEQNYVLVNFKEKNPSIIASELNMKAVEGQAVDKDGVAVVEVTANQVSGTVRNARKKVLALIAAATEAGDQAKADSLTAQLEEKLPKRTFKGTGGNKGPRVSSLDSIVDSLFVI